MTGSRKACFASRVRLKESQATLRERHQIPLCSSANIDSTIGELLTSYVSVSMTVSDFSQYQGPVPEWEEFVGQTGFKHPDAQDISPERLRHMTNEYRVKAARAILGSTDLLAKVTWQDHSILTRDYQNIVARAYRRREQKTSDGATQGLAPVYLHFHGGGFLNGNIDSEDVVCCRIVADMPMPVIVVSVNYRHTPEWQWPTQFNDAWDAFQWLAHNITELGGDSEKVLVGGTSAGGGLAAGVASWYAAGKGEYSTRDRFQLLGQILCSPWLLHPSQGHLLGLNTDNSRCSYSQNQDAPTLPWHRLKLFSDLLGQAAESHPDFNLALASNTEQLKRLPKTAVLVAGQDLLRDEALLYGEKVKDHGSVSLHLKAALVSFHPDVVVGSQPKFTSSQDFPMGSADSKNSHLRRGGKKLLYKVSCGV